MKVGQKQFAGYNDVQYLFKVVYCYRAYKGLTLNIWGSLAPAKNILLKEKEYVTGIGTSNWYYM